MSYASNLDFPILIVSVRDNKIQVDDGYHAIKEVLALNNYHFIHAESNETALAMARKEAGIGCIIINECDGANLGGGSPIIKEIIRVTRAKNSRVPIFFFVKCAFVRAFIDGGDSRDP